VESSKQKKEEPKKAVIAAAETYVWLIKKIDSLARQLQDTQPVLETNLTTIHIHLRKLTSIHLELGGVRKQLSLQHQQENPPHL